MDNLYTKIFLNKSDHLDKIGEYTYCKLRIMYWGENARLKIGYYCSIAEGVVVFLGGNHRLEVHDLSIFRFYIRLVTIL